MIDDHYDYRFSKKKFKFAINQPSHLSIYFNSRSYLESYYQCITIMRKSIQISPMSPLYFSSLSLSLTLYFYEVESIYFINNNNGNSFRCRRFRCNIFNSKLSHLNFSKFQVLPFFVSCLSRERKRKKKKKRNRNRNEI